jgi:hypothetical protein
VRRLVLRATAKLSLGRAGKVFAGYPVVVPVKAPGVVDGTTLTIERRQGAGFRKVGSATALQETGEAVVKTMRVRGRLHKRRVKRGRVELSVANCVGGVAYAASRRG